MNREQVFEFFRRLAEANPSPTTELDYTNPYTLLVAVVLSAQATDASVNIACRPLFERIDDDRIVGHSDVAPERKDDPGELFPWKRLAEAGHGLWAEAAAAPGAPLAEGEESAAVFALQAGFTRLGYDLPPSGRFDAATKAVVTAFQRHWRQDRVDGIADGETRARLIALLRLAG